MTMLRRWLQRDGALVVLAGLAGMVLVALLQLAAFAPLERMGLQLFDAYQHAAPRDYRDAGVRVVDIDEESIRRLGQWPWPRTELAQLNRTLSGAGAAAIAYDIVLVEPDRTSPPRLAHGLERDGMAPGLATRLAKLPDHDAIFAKSVAQAPVVLGMILETQKRGRPFEPKSGFTMFGSLPKRDMLDYPGSTQSLAEFNQAASGVASLTHQSDGDGIVRQIPLIALYDGALVPSLSLEAVRVARGGGQSVAVYGSDAGVETPGMAGAAAGLRVGSIEIPTTADGRLWLYLTRDVPSRTIPAWKVLSGTMSQAELAREFKGGIVFIGTSAAGLRDLVSTPIGRDTPGVMVHAQATEQMLLDDFLVRPDWAPGLELFLVLLLGGALAFFLPRMGAAIGALVSLTGIAALAAGSWTAFGQLHYLFDPLYPALAIALVYTVQTVLSFYREEKQRAYIHSAFDKYLSPELVRQIAADPERLELGGEEKEMTVLMCDIRGFSRISEQFSPKQVIDFLIEFLTPMSDILLGHQATLDKYMGDAILAFWNAPLHDPDHPTHAADAALAMVAMLEQLNHGGADSPDRCWPGEVEIGIGINTGMCCVGNMGSRQRLSYSLIGDTVNLASRLEGQTKLYGVPIIIGHALAEAIASYALIELDRIRVVGRNAPETIYALLGDPDVAQSGDHAQIRTVHSQMLKAYRAADWAAAEQILEQSGQAYDKAGLAKLASLYRSRCEDLSVNPSPAEWDGIFQAQEK